LLIMGLALWWETGTSNCSGNFALRRRKDTEPWSRSAVLGARLCPCFLVHWHQSARSGMIWTTRDQYPGGMERKR
jgi:hypothetical protein